MSNKTDVSSFDDAINEHKRLLTESLINFDEGQRVRKIMLEIDINSADYEYYFKSGQQSKQADIEELQIGNHNLSVMTAEAESYSEYWKYERDKLQKRIDLALDYIQPSDEISHKVYRELYKILKGEEA